MYSGIYAIGASKKITKEAYNKDTYEEINKAYITTIKKLRGMLTNYFSIFSFFLVSQGVFVTLTFGIVNARYSRSSVKSCLSFVFQVVFTIFFILFQVENTIVFAYANKKK